MKILALVACLALAPLQDGHPSGNPIASKILKRESERLLQPTMTADDAAQCLYHLTVVTGAVLQSRAEAGDIDEVTAALKKLTGHNRLRERAGGPDEARGIMLRQLRGHLERLASYRRMEAQVARLEARLKEALGGEAVPTRQELSDLALEVSHRAKQLADVRQRRVLRRQLALAKRDAAEAKLAEKLSEATILRNLDRYRRQALGVDPLRRRQRAQALWHMDKWKRIAKLKGLEVPRR